MITVKLIIIACSEKICFSRNCWWIKAKVRCYGCPYVDPEGKILDERVGGKLHVLPQTS